MFKFLSNKNKVEKDDFDAFVQRSNKAHEELMFKIDMLKVANPSFIKDLISIYNPIDGMIFNFHHMETFITHALVSMNQYLSCDDPDTFRYLNTRNCFKIVRDGTDKDVQLDKHAVTKGYVNLLYIKTMAEYVRPETEDTVFFIDDLLNIIDIDLAVFGNSYGLQYDDVKHLVNDEDSVIQTFIKDVDRVKQTIEEFIFDNSNSILGRVDKKLSKLNEELDDNKKYSYDTIIEHVTNRGLLSKYIIKDHEGNVHDTLSVTHTYPSFDSEDTTTSLAMLKLLFYYIY